MHIEHTKKFADLLESIAEEKLELSKKFLESAREYKDILDLPSKKENWDIREDAEEKLDIYLQKTVQVLYDVAVITEGLAVFQEGLNYRKLKTDDRLKIKGRKVDEE
jgi:hypothetical protein